MEDYDLQEHDLMHIMCTCGLDFYIRTEDAEEIEGCPFCGGLELAGDDGEKLSFFDLSGGE